MRGYSTYNRKLTENKWKAGTAKPELVEDWDQRMVITTLTRDQQGNVIELHQAAEKDQVHQDDFITHNLYITRGFRNFVLTASPHLKWTVKMRTSWTSPYR